MMGIPKIMLIDIDEETKSSLLKKGFNITNGTFGEKYFVGHFEECGLNFDLPNIIEQDILVLDLMNDNGVLGVNPLQYNQWQCDRKSTIMSHSEQKIFNPRNRAFSMHADAIVDLLSRGKVIIVFVDEPKEESYNFFSYLNGTKNFIKKSTESNFFTFFDSGLVEKCYPGKEIIIEEDYTSIFKECEDQARYNCYFKILPDTRTGILCRNISGDVISFMQIFGKNKGILIILPQFLDKCKIINNILIDFLPDVKPELLPELVKNSWLNFPEYEMPEIRSLKIEKQRIIEEFEQRINFKDNEIDEKVSEFSFLNGILTSDGFNDNLVNNIKLVLLYIGYKIIVNVDKKTEGNLQEDLQILDDGHFTVIEIKGHNGNPTEDDCQQLVKYISRRMRTESRYDIKGILIENHQKMLPPKERKNPAFTKEQIRDADRDKYTLVSTWELYQAVRLFQLKIISHQIIDSELHTPGLFNAIPKTWQELKIEKFYKNNTIACFILDIDIIIESNVLLIVNENEYSTLTIEEMQSDDKKINCGKRGDRISIKLENPVLSSARIFLTDLV